MATAPDGRTKLRYNVIGAIALALGVIGLLLSIVPYGFFFAWMPALLAVLLGLIARRRGSAALSVVGLITGALALAVCCIWFRAVFFGEEVSTRAGEEEKISRAAPYGGGQSAPLIQASIKGVWSELEANKIAAVAKYRGKRLAFTNEVVDGSGGNAAYPRITFEAEREGSIVNTVSASFLASDADWIGAIGRGTKVSFTCNEFNESLGGGYSLTDCSRR